MRLGYTMCPGRGDTDLLLARFAEELRTRGFRTCGTVQVNTEHGDAQPCDMDVRVLPDGPTIRISQSLGKSAQGCRLDTAALEEAVGLVTARVARGGDVLIINKFGKYEAEGGGFRDVIAHAAGKDMPVLVGLNELNQPAFDRFAGGLAVFVPPHLDELLQWLDR